ncbi:MAG: FtsX-like permease family protein [Bryobacteraceae bacterium]
MDERLAKRLWPEGAIGKRLSVFRTGWRHDVEVVGVAAAARTNRVRDEGIPYFMIPSVESSLAIETAATVEQIASAIRSAAAQAHVGRAVSEIHPMSELVADSIGDTRFVLAVLTAFAIVSVLLAAAGLYGALAYLTARRAREFGIRLSLGSSSHAIVAIVIRESVRFASAGAALGLAGALAVARAFDGMLYGVGPTDATTLALAAASMGIVALLAGGVPAWTAARIDPKVSLRSE